MSSTDYARLIGKVDSGLMFAGDHLNQLTKTIKTEFDLMRLAQLETEIIRCKTMVSHIVEGRDFHDPDNVQRTFACPYCGEERYDWLVWDDFDLLNCQSCGTVYDPTDPKG